MANKNITYLFGAGASANAVPLVKDFQKRSDGKPSALDIFFNLLDKHKIENSTKIFGNGNVTYRDVYLHFKKDIAWLMRICETHASVDTYAKILSVTQDRQNLHRLKYTFATYLMFQQYMNAKPVDPRYDTFFASISDLNQDGKIELPNNIKIISWNYDIQFEKSYSRFLNNAEIHSVHRNLNIFPRIGDIIIPNSPPIHKISKEFTDKFCIIKLNGTAGIFGSKEEGYQIDHFYKGIEEKIKQSNEAMIEHFLFWYEYMKSRPPVLKDFFTFAWENSTVSRKSIEYAQKVAEDTEILVIVGYSFPFFNRKVDKAILKVMAENKKLFRVYYQAPEADIKFMERFKALTQYPKIEPYTDTDQFFIPYEFD